MHEDHEKSRRDWRIPDAWRERIVPLLPPRKLHTLGVPSASGRGSEGGCHVLRAPHRLPGECAKKTGLCSSRVAPRRFHAWTAAGVFLALWKRRA